MTAPPGQACVLILTSLLCVAGRNLSTARVTTRCPASLRSSSATSLYFTAPPRGAGGGAPEIILLNEEPEKRSETSPDCRPTRERRSGCLAGGERLSGSALLGSLLRRRLRPKNETKVSPITLQTLQNSGRVAGYLLKSLVSQARESTVLRS